MGGRRRPGREHPHPEGLRVPRHARADVAEPDDEEGPPPERGERDRPPPAFALLLGVVREPAGEGEHRAGDALGEVGSKHPRAVGDRDPVRVPGREVVEARPAHLDPAHRRVARDRRVHGVRRPGVLDREDDLGVVLPQPREDLLGRRRVDEPHVRKARGEEVPEVVRLVVGDQHRGHRFAPRFVPRPLLTHRRGGTQRRGRNRERPIYRTEALGREEDVVSMTQDRTFKPAAISRRWHRTQGRFTLSSGGERARILPSPPGRGAGGEGPRPRILPAGARRSSCKGRGGSAKDPHRASESSANPLPADRSRFGEKP